MNLYGFASGDPVNFSDPLGLDPCKDSSAWTECLAQAVADWGAQHGGAVGKAAVNAGAASNAAMEATGINGAASAGDAIGNGDVVSGTLSAAMMVGGPLGEEAQPALKLLHDEKTLLKRGLDYFRKQGTEDIVRSLQPGNKEALVVKATGTVMNGNHPIFVLMERGFDVNSLPRVPRP